MVLQDRLFRSAELVGRHSVLRRGAFPVSSKLIFAGVVNVLL